MSDVPVRLLRETLRDTAATAASPACLDADTLAAWSDDVLSGADRAAAESHAANCARCQAMLAAMALTAPPPPARRWWHAGTFRWLVPLAAAAAAVVLWVAIPSTPVAPQTAAPRAPLIATGLPAPPEPRASDAATVRLQPETAKPKAAPRPPSLPSSTPVGVDAFAFSAAPAAPLPLAAPSAAPPPAPIEEAIVVAPNANESVQLRSERAAAAAPAQAFAKTSASAPDILSPDRNVRWRIRTPGSVDRSTDGGLTWQTQAAGVATPLLGGAAPSPAICWVVGRGGVVLRSTDGATWRRVGLSDAIDLIAIRASDATNATVTAADGRTFTTADGGTTWRAR